MSSQILDHIIILLPYSQLVSPPSWLTTNFTISSGGVHSDGRTENRLIIFQDGTYIELIAFVNDDPARKEGHVWGKKPFGLIDISLTTGDNAAAHYAALSGRLNAPDSALGIRYLEPVEGGRTKRDGTELKWQVTFPTTQTPSLPGAIPFFCHDTTPRDLRVDASDVEATTHPSGVKGIAQISVSVPAEKLESFTELYALILDKEPLHSSGFQLATPIRVPGEHPWISIQAAEGLTFYLK